MNSDLKMRSILIIEDEKKVALAIRQGLESEGYDAVVAGTGEEGFFLASTRPFDLILLDWMLPARSGIEILKTIRGKGDATPVLILTARDAVEDRVLGLDSGADDYLVKPFAFEELLARIRNLLRRGKTEGTVRMKLADLNIDLTARRVSRKGESVPVTAREFDLLECLMRNQGRVVSRETLAREVWKESARATPLYNVIDVHMVRLRRKLDDHFATKLIHTIRGVGFILKAGDK
jgi:two-component system, OmpR family, copper resistance phosphate regulon response regulator CusR